jgi:hypothetical protein
MRAGQPGKMADLDAWTREAGKACVWGAWERLGAVWARLVEAFSGKTVVIVSYPMQSPYENVSPERV